MFRRLLPLVLLLCAPVFSEVLSNEALKKIGDVNLHLDSELGYFDKTYGRDSAELTDYRSEFQTALGNRAVRATVDDLIEKAVSARFLLVGDSHIDSGSKRLTSELIRELKKRGIKVILATESLHSGVQSKIDAFSRGEIALADFRSAVAFDKHWNWPWAAYEQMFETARANGVPIVALEDRSRGGTLSERDGAIAAKLRELSSQTGEKTCVLVHVGTYHTLGKNHLHDRLQTWSLGRVLTLVGSAEMLYWNKLTEYRDPRKLGPLRMAPDVFFVPYSSPLEGKVQELLKWYALVGDTQRAESLKRDTATGDMVERLRPFSLSWPPVEPSCGGVLKQLAD